MPEVIHQIQIQWKGNEQGRPSWDEYVLAFAQTASIRGDCRRRKVGAAIMRPDHRIAITGCNGSPPGGPSCLKGECPRGVHYKVDMVHPRYDYATLDTCGTCLVRWPCKKSVSPGSSYDTGPGACIALHAEQNAIIFCRPEDRYGSTIGITDWPCDGCYRLIKGVGLARIVTPNRTETL